MAALTKADLAEHIFNVMGLNKREAKELIELFFEEIRQALENGESVKLSGFGNFNLRDKKPKAGEKPQNWGRNSNYGTQSSYFSCWTQASFKGRTLCWLRNARRV